MVLAKDEVAQAQSVFRRVKTDGVFRPVIHVNDVAFLVMFAQILHRRADVLAQFRRGEVFVGEGDGPEEQGRGEDEADRPREPARAGEKRRESLRALGEEESQRGGEEKDHPSRERVEGQEGGEEGEEEGQEEEEAEAGKSPRESDRPDEKERRGDEVGNPQTEQVREGRAQGAGDPRERGSAAGDEAFAPEVEEELMRGELAEVEEVERGEVDDPDRADEEEGGDAASVFAAQGGEEEREAERADDEQRGMREPDRERAREGEENHVLFIANSANLRISVFVIRVFGKFARGPAIVGVLCESEK